MNNVIIGIESGQDITKQSNYVIIGDRISMKDVEEKKIKDTIFIGEKIAIGKTILGVECNLYDILFKYFKENNVI